MANKILVPVDGSDFSNKALRYAISFAKPMEAELILLNVQPSYNTPNISRFINKEDLKEYQEQLGHEAIEDALTIAEEFKGLIKVSTKIRIGSPISEICKEAKAEEALCIVMGSRGLGAVKRTLLGSVSYKVLHEAPCPVTIVP